MYNPETDRVTQGKRLKKFREEITGLNQSAFAESLGMLRGSYSDIERGRNSISPRFLHYLLDVYPAINLNWLIGGRGDMIISKQLSTDNQDNDDILKSIIERIDSIEKKLED